MVLLFLSLRAQGSSTFTNNEGSESPPCTTLRFALDFALAAVSKLLCDIHMQLAPNVKNYPCLTGLFNDQERSNPLKHDSPKQHLKQLKVRIYALTYF